MAVLFDKDGTNVRKHINNVYKSTEVDKDNNTLKMRVDGVKQPVAFYSLDVILAVGYRENSRRGIAFRKLTNMIIRHYVSQMEMHQYIALLTKNVFRWLEKIAAFTIFMYES